MEIFDKRKFLNKNRKKLKTKKQVKLILISSLMFMCLYFTIDFSKIMNTNNNVKLQSTLDYEADGNSNYDQKIVNNMFDNIVFKSVVLEPKTSEKTNNLKNDILEYLLNYQGNYGIYYYNIKTKDAFGIDENGKYVAASTIKIPLNIYLYFKIKQGYLNPNGTLTYTQKDFEAGTGKIQEEKIESRYTLKKLSSLSIAYSDNIATNMLFRFLGKSNMYQFTKKIGATIPYNDENLSTPKDMTIYMKGLYDFYLENGETGNELMNNFLNTQFNDRIPGLLPKGVKVAHKVGTQVRIFNDVAIVFTKNTYILSIMSKDIDENQGTEAISNISKMIYDSVISSEN